MASLVACDIHPLNNLRVLNMLREQFGAGEEQISGWIGHWIREGFDALEQLVSRWSGMYAFGDEPTLVDCTIVPQLYSAERFNVDLSPYPRIVATAEAARKLPAVMAAHPNAQPDAD